MTREERILLGFSFCGDHTKAHVGRIDAKLHFRMLLTAMRMIDPQNAYQKIVSALAFSDAGAEELAEEVRRNATVISREHNPGHQAGAGASIYAAIEWAAAHRFDYLVFLADDVFFWIRDPIARMIEPLQSSGACYCGSPWGMLSEINTQVFSCRPASLCRDGVCVFRDQSPHKGLLEHHVLGRMRHLRIPHLHSGPCAFEYYHQHRPKPFLDAAAAFAYPGLAEEERLREYVSGKRFVYRRVGYDERAMELMADGRIGEGRTNGQSEWRIDPREGKAYLSLHGHTGTICQLKSDDDGVLRGRWLRFERMPIEMTPEPQYYARPVVKPGSMSQALVVARYHEDLSWTMHPVFASFRKYIYDKSGYGQRIVIPNATVVRMPNTGRDMHTYFHHLVQHYHELEDVIWLVKGDPFAEAPNILEIARTDIGQYRELATAVVASDGRGLPHHRKGLRVREAYERIFGVPFPGTVEFPVGGMVAVSKNTILKRSQAFYRNVLEWTVTNTGPWEVERLVRTMWKRDGLHKET